MKKGIKTCILFALSFNLYQTNLSAFAEEIKTDDIENLSDLSLEDLLNINVTTASKREEKLRDAPGNITAYSSNDIEELGYYTLSDLANITPGYSSYTIYGEKVFETRGQKAGSFNNNKHLLLVDGMPIHNARNYKVPTEEELPLYFAERVEFLKGPASSLYGTGAFFGVVNVIPKSLKENGNKLETKVSLGTQDFNKRVMANALHKDDFGEAKLNLGYYKKDASRAFVGTTNDDNNRYWDDQNSVFFNASYKMTQGILDGLGGGIIYLSKNGGLGEHWMEGQYSSQLNDLTWESFIPYIKYQKSFTDKWKVNSYLKFNESMEKGFWAPFNKDSFKAYQGTGNLFNAYDARVSNIEALAETYYDFNDRTNAIFGLNFDTRYQKGIPASYSYLFMADPGVPFDQEKSTIADSNRFNTYSAYAQLSYRAPLLKDLLITLGARQDIGQSIGQKDVQFYQQLSPRIALVQKLTDNLNLKFMWGNALRAPGIKETGLNSEARATYGSEVKDLKAETIGTFEGGITFANENISSQITGFMNKTINALDGSKLKDANIFINATGETNASGVEADAEYAFNKDFKLFANYAFAMAKDPSNKALNDIPIHKANFGANYVLRFPFTISSSLIGKYVSGYTTADPKLASPAGSFVLDLNFVAPLKENLSVELQIRNLLDQQYKLPKNGQPDIPMPGRSALLSLNYRM